MLEVALMTSPSFLINVALNRDQQITAMFAGEMVAAHAQGCDFVKENAMVSVNQRFDIVITTNSGYPLDQNLYQSIKGISAANRITREGGSIISVVACEDGIPDYGGYLDLLKRGGSPEGILEMVQSPGFLEHDQWQVQIQAMIQKKADVFVYSDGLRDEQITAALFKTCRDIPAMIKRLITRYGEDVSISVLPEGPQTVPVLQA
jgi:nickel-dependent lactate racemase